MQQDPLNLLLIEPTFPGRLGATAHWLASRRGYRCQFFCAHVDTTHAPEFAPGLDVVQFGVGGVAREQSAPWHRQLERALCYAYGCWEVLEQRRPRGIDLVLARSAGAGSSLFAPVFQRDVPIVNLFDYFYHPRANDLAEETGADVPAEYFCWRRSANAMDLLDLENGVQPWTLTEWQRRLFPAEYRDDFFVLYDGVDTRRVRLRSRRNRTIGGKSLPAETRVVTFIARYLDQLRGFDRFAELANRLMRARPDVVFVVIGNPIVHRGLDVRHYGQDYRAHVFTAHPLVEPERMWFFHDSASSVVAEALAASDLHVYASRPYVVSRSLVEAMASGCTVLASDSEPVREFIDERTAIVVPPNSMDEWETQALRALDDADRRASLGQAAQERVREKYDRDELLPRLAERLSAYAARQ